MRDEQIRRDAEARRGVTDTTARTAGSATTGTLARLEDLDDYGVADGYPDPRGWSVRARDGRKVGEVKNLLVDRQALRVRYLEVELDEGVLTDSRRDHTTGRDRDDRLIHVPVEQARLDDDQDDVRLNLDAAALGALGRADERNAAPVTADHHRQFFGRRAPQGDAPYLVLHEERLAVGTRAVEGGTVRVHKSVETERVQERVPVREEHVTVERHAVSPERARSMDGRAQIGEDEIRVPVMREEVVTEKRVVPTEEVVVRKEVRTEQKTINDTVRKERAVVEGDGVTRDRRPDGGTA